MGWNNGGTAPVYAFYVGDTMRLGVKDALYLFIIFLLVVQLWSISRENERLREEQKSIKETLVTSQLIYEIFELRRMQS